MSRRSPSLPSIYYAAIILIGLVIVVLVTAVCLIGAHPQGGIPAGGPSLTPQGNPG